MFNLKFVFNILDNHIGCPKLFEHLNFKTISFNSRNKSLFYPLISSSAYSMHSPANKLMSVSNLSELISLLYVL